jgi:hypothetical protein
MIDRFSDEVRWETLAGASCIHSFERLLIESKSSENAFYQFRGPAQRIVAIVNYDRSFHQPRVVSHQSYPFFSGSLIVFGKAEFPEKFVPGADQR